MTNPPRPATLVAHEPRLELNYKGEIRTYNLTESYHVLGRETGEDPPISLEVPQKWTVVSRVQACIRKQGADYQIYDGNGEDKPSSNRLFINNTLITPKEGYLLKPGDILTIGQNKRDWVTITYFDPNKVRPGTLPQVRSIILKDRSVLIGRDETATIQLEAPTISRRHAVIDISDQGRYCLQDYSINGTFVNDQKVSGSVILTDGDTIRIGPYTFILQKDELILIDEGSKVRLDAKNLLLIKYKNKQPIKLLNNISLAIEPGQLVGIVGGSGSGKSTLIKTLLGLEEISQDKPNKTSESTVERVVYLNGDNLRKYFNIYRSLIGYVPQQDIVHTNLTVTEVLEYAAKLRLPADINIHEVVQKTLEAVELSERKDTLVKDLSGGQLKRVSIGVELLADPKLFLLDEPTSGLDPGLDKKMMQLLRKLANEGRTVILVTHATNNITLCDRLVFLGLGGNLCYYGEPDKAIEFFEIESQDFADIYIKLENRETVLKETARYHESPYHKEYIDDRLAEISQGEHNAPKQVKAPFFRQLWVLMQRYVALILRDRVSLALSLLTAPIGIGLINIAIRNQDPLIQFNTTGAFLALKVVFIFTCAAIWVGLASSLQEIVKESAIYLRERLVNLGLFAYLTSKIVTLGGLAVIQTLLMTAVILISFKDPEPSYGMSWIIGVFITTFLTLFASLSLGLMVSAAVKNITQANSALPLLLLPQIIFAGVLFHMKAQAGKIISWLMLSRWSVGAYGVLVDINGMVPDPAKSQAKDFLDNAKTIAEQKAQVSLYEQDWNNLLLNWGILGLHILVYWGVTYWLQKRKDVF